MKDPTRLPVRFSLLTAVVWLLVAGGIIFLLWQVINRLSATDLPISTPTPDHTRVYQTFSAFLTPEKTGGTNTATDTITPSPTIIPSQQTALPLPSEYFTSTPEGINPTPTPEVPCNRAAAGNPIDITIPDDSLISPGQSFVKTWKLVNNGTCTWTASYSTSFFYGDRMAAPESAPLNKTVLPAQSVEISIEMVAPHAAGTYQGNWMLSDPDGVMFGIGPNGDAPFWVRIIVPESPSNTATPEPSITATPVVTTTQSTPATAIPTETSTVTPTPTTTPAIQANAELSPMPGDSIDLDTLTLTSEGGDLKYQLDADNYHWLSPVDEARIGVYGNITPQLASCQSAGMSQAPIAVESLTVGTYLCYSTNQGLFGRALFVALNPDNYTLTLDLVTWAQP